MTTSAPVMFPATSLARNVTSAATSSGRVNRPVTDAPAAAAATAPGSPPWLDDTLAAMPSAPSHRSVETGPGLTVLTRIPFGPSSFDNDLQKLRRAALAAL